MAKIHEYLDKLLSELKPTSIKQWAVCIALIALLMLMGYSVVSLETIIRLLEI